MVHGRIVSIGNAVHWERRCLEIPPQGRRSGFAGNKVEICRAFNAALSFSCPDTRLESRNSRGVTRTASLRSPWCFNSSVLCVRQLPVSSPLVCGPAATHLGDQIPSRTPSGWPQIRVQRRVSELIERMVLH
jgi:hypothetical protein